MRPYGKVKGTCHATGIFQEEGRRSKMANQQLLCKNTLFKVLGLTLGAVIYTAGLDLFLVPNHVIDGGVIGIP